MGLGSILNRCQAGLGHQLDRKRAERCCILDKDREQSEAVGWFQSRLPSGLWLVLAILLILTACDRQPGIKASMVQLENAFPAAAASGQDGQPPLNEANAYIHSVLAAVRSNDFAAAVVVLHSAARLPGMTPEQFLAVDQTRKALMTELLNRAARGDTNAQADLQSIEQARSR